jgi:hypothetical protein
MRPSFLVWILALAVVMALAAPAEAVDRTFAGSAQIDYLFVPTAKGASADQGTFGTLDGFTLEASLKVAVDITDHLSANVKLCYGCHGFEADMVYFDLRAADELNFRIGRFSPSFGNFNVRHDPANQKLSDKPLPYDMGRMLRWLDWNDGILPSPFPDNGVEVDGTHWFGQSAAFEYAAYGVAGFRALESAPTDINFPESHFITGTRFYVDNNALPAGGARLAFTLKPSSISDVSFGLSGMTGTYDNQNQLLYAIAGADFAVRVKRTNFRLEYLVRRTEFSTSDPAEFKYAIAPAEGNFFMKHGAYAELEQPVMRDLDFVVRVDGLLRMGNVPAYATTLSSQSGVLRETVGLAYTVERNLRLKASVEGYEWTDKDASGHMNDLAVHLGVVGTF